MTVKMHPPTTYTGAFVLQNDTGFTEPDANGDFEIPQEQVAAMINAGWTISAYVEEPGTAVTDGRVACFDGTGGNKLKQGTRTEAVLVAGPSSVTDAVIAVFDGTTGKLIKAGTQDAASVATGPASAVNGNFAAFNGTGGKILEDSGKTAANFTLAPVGAPGNWSATGVAGTWAYDSTHLYVCIGTNSWVRAGFSTW